MFRCTRYKRALAKRKQRLQEAQAADFRKFYWQLYDEYLHMGYEGAASMCLELARLRNAANGARIDLYAGKEAV